MIIKIRYFVFLIVAAQVFWQFSAFAEEKERSYAGSLIVSDAKLNDPFFTRTVVLVLEHNEKGAVGIVVNRQLALAPLSKFAEGFGIDSGNLDNMIPLIFGGPIRPDALMALHTTEYRSDATKLITEKVALSPTDQVIEAIARGGGPQHVLVAMGHAGWGPRQLESEMMRGSWHVAAAHPDIVFGREGRIQKWWRAMKSVPLNL